MCLVVASNQGSRRCYSSSPENTAADGDSADFGITERKITPRWREREREKGGGREEEEDVEEEEVKEQKVSS